MKTNEITIKRLAIAVIAGITFIASITFLVVPSKNESVDTLKNVDISHSSYLISSIVSELNQVVGKREPNLRFSDVGDRMRLGDTFQKLQEAGKATAEEVEAIKEFEKALNNLSKTIRRLDSIPSLRREMRL